MDIQGTVMTVSQTVVRISIALPSDTRSIRCVWFNSCAGETHVVCAHFVRWLVMEGDLNHVNDSPSDKIWECVGGCAFLCCRQKHQHSS